MQFHFLQKGAFSMGKNIKLSYVCLHVRCLWKCDSNYSMLDLRLVELASNLLLLMLQDAYIYTLYYAYTIWSPDCFFSLLPKY